MSNKPDKSSPLSNVAQPTRMLAAESLQMVKVRRCEQARVAEGTHKESDFLSTFITIFLERYPERRALLLYFH